MILCHKEKGQAVDKILIKKEYNNALEKTRLKLFLKKKSKNEKYIRNRLYVCYIIYILYIIFYHLYYIYIWANKSYTECHQMSITHLRRKMWIGTSWEVPIQMANKHKNWPTPLIIRKTQIEITKHNYIKPATWEFTWCYYLRKLFDKFY